MALPIKYSTGGLTHPALKKGDLAVGIGSVEYGGIFQNALEFDGSNDYVAIPSINVTDSFTFSFWANDGGGGVAVYVGNNVNDDSLYKNALNKLQIGINNSFFNFILASDTVLNEWSHYVITKDVNSVRLYVDGVEATNSPHTYPAGTAVFKYIGRYRLNNLFFNGKMDEAAVWESSVATQQNVTDLYNSGNGAVASSVIASPTAYWRFNETSGTTLTDETGNYNGTLNNFTLPGAWVTGYQNSIELPSNGSYINGYTISTLDSSFNYHTFPITHDSQLVITANSLGGTSTTPTEAKVYLAGRSNTFILNNTPPNIVTSGSVLNLESNNLSSYPTSGINAYDLSGGGNDGTLINGVGFNTNGYFEFDGTDERILLNDTLDTVFTTQYWTVDIWFNLNSTYAGYDAMLGNGFPFQLYVHAGKIKAYLSSTAGSATYFLNGMTSTQTISVDTWYHLSFVRNGTNYYYYINGALDKSATSSTDVCAAANQNAQIGNLYNESDVYTWKGDISNVKIYNREITTSEIKQNYYQAPIVTDGLVFALDAGNLASYENGDVTTYSLTGSQSGTLTNGVGYSNNNGGKWVFDGADDYIDLGSITSANPLSLYGLNEFTIEFWAKVNGTGDGYQRIIDKSTAGGTANGWGIYFGANASDNFIALTTSGNNLLEDTSPRDFGNWVHYVFTKNGNNYGFWMNGELKQTNTNTTTIPSTTANCRIGSWNHSTGRELNGEIAIFRIYDKTLTIDEVRGNFESQRNRFTKYSSPFKMTVTTTTINEDFTLPFTSVGQYNCVVDWGDGSSNEIIVYNDAALTHTYASSGDHQITISGVFGGVSFVGSNTTMRLKLKSIDQWGTNQWKKMATAFYYCRNVVINAGDAPNLGDITSLSQMFYFNDALTGDLSNWDVSNINDFYFMFRDCSSFNSDLSNWDVNNVTNITYMFYGCSSFNSDLSNWDVSNVTNFFNMFFGCSSFNGDVSNWDVSNATNMEGMFRSCINFNQDISSWDVSSVTNFKLMLESCRIFNQDISSWNVGSGVDMTSMLGNCWALNQDLSYWERSTVGDVSTVGNVTNMSSLFYRNYAFNSDLSNWDVSSVTTMYHMFRDITAHSLGDVSNWDVSNVTNMGLMFYNCQLFESDISNWNVTSTLTTMNGMFTNCYKFNSDLSNWNVSSVTNFTDTFKNTLIFNRPLSNWERSTVGDVSTVGNVTNMNGMFYNSAFNQDIGGWDVSNVADFTNFMGLKTPSNFSSANLDAIYSGWSLLTLSPNEVITFGTAKYNASAQNGRDTLTSSPNNWTITDGGLTPALFITATGGTITTDGDFKVHSFNSSSTFTVTSLGTDSTYGDVVDYLVVAGGGGGGARAGGGGGAGGLLEASNYTVSATAYTVTIGAGGAGRASARGRGNAGNNSLFGAVTSTGGGFGGGAANNENPGGSGGSGGGSHNNAAVGTGTTGQGNNGGLGSGSTGGGGGGAGAVGGNHSGNTGGNGGNGLQSNISGTNQYYAGGGGGGANATPGTGGNGGGGAGSSGTANATPGTVNTGGGGGGSGYQSSNQGNGGNGGSGIVIVRYKFQ